MNTGPDFRPSNGGPNDPPQEPQAGAGGFFSWIRSLDVQRRSDDRWFAGVASGIAGKAGIDPIIVRGIFVVLALLGGPGILLYLVGWLFLPDSSGKIHSEELVRGRATPGVIIAAVIIGLWLVTGLFTGGTFGIRRWDLWNVIGVPGWLNVTFTWVFWIAVCVGVGYLVHLAVLQHGNTQRGRAHQPGQTPRPDHAEGAGQESPASFSDTINEWGQSVNDRANSWSVEYASRHERLSLGRAHSLITVALALIAAGVAALVASTSDSVLVAALLAATAVLALSMILAGIRGKNSGGIGFLGFLGVVALSVTAVLPAGTTYHAFGHHSVEGTAPSTVAFIGDTTVDLAQYDRTDQTQLDITQFAGDITLQLPENRPTHLTIDVGAGSIEATGLDWRHQSGVLNRRSVHVNENGPGETLNVYVRLFAGTVILESAQ